MADEQISGLTAASALDGSEKLHVVQGGNSRETSTLDIANTRFRGALIKKASDLTGQNMTTLTALTWDTEVYDVGNWFAIGNPTRLTVPAGVTKVRVSGQIALASITADMWVAMAVNKNNAVFDGYARQVSEVGSTTPGLNIHSAVVAVTAGDYFELKVQLETDTTVDITAAGSWFAIEAVQ